MRVNDQVEAIFDKINDMLRTKDFSDLDMVLEMRDKLFDTIVEAILTGDPDTARTTMEEHCDATSALLRGLIG